jgi:DNA-binding transcriptional MocR family regulator
MHTKRKTQFSGKLIDRVYQDIRTLIINHGIRPGQHIHIQNVANALNTSATPVREALNRLLNEGLVYKQHGRGFYNKHIDIKELKDLFELRGTLVISAMHVAITSDIHISAPSDDSSNINDIDICIGLINAIDNAEMRRIYNNILDRTMFAWNAYASSDNGKADIQVYRYQLNRFLLERNTFACVEVVNRNTRLQIRALGKATRAAVGYILHNNALGS